MSSKRPTFVDNRAGNTLANAINEYLEFLKASYKDPPQLDVATAYFNPQGFSSIADHLEECKRVRILIGAEAVVKDQTRWRKPGEPKGEKHDAEQLEEGLKLLSESIKQDRDLLGFSFELDNELKRLIAFLGQKKVEVRRYEKAFLHGKAFLFSNDEGVIAGSSNFTGAGLNYNLELNLGQRDQYVFSKVQDWFEDLWKTSVPYDLAAVYGERFKPFSPYIIYLRVLWERYRDEIEEQLEDQADRAIELTTFQNDGVFRAKRFLKQYNGVLVADGVGLGKTFIGGELIREAVHDRRQRALVIAPAYLRDGLWQRFGDELNVHFTTLSFEQIRNDVQLGGSGHYLLQDKDEYQLIVIDEAHGFRNPNTQQAHALRLLLQGDPPKDLILLTATPVNNSLWDLYYMLSYFIKNDALFASFGIPSLRQRFHDSQAEDPSNLSPSALFDILDRTTVRRTRHFIEKYYPNDRIRKDDEWIYITFPEVNPVRVDYTFSKNIDDQFFADIEEGLAAGEKEAPGLTLALYRPSQYGTKGEEGSELALVGLLRTGLLKRFESSRKAFSETLDRMISRYKAAIELLEKNVFPEPRAIDEWIESDSDEAFIEALAEESDDGHKLRVISADELDKPRLKADLESDIKILERWKDKADSIDIQDDAKLQQLKQVLIELRKKAEQDAAGDEEKDRRNRKVLIYSYFEDTVDWILEYLNTAVFDKELECYQGRIAAVAGRESKGGINRDRAVSGFAPESTEAPTGTEDEFDILVTTDVLAQGVNLQQCRNVINYDLPWNPMRVVQRNGRIDRINSPHRQIFTYSFFSEDRLDELLALEYRIMKKLAQAAKSIGLENKVFPNVEAVDQNFADRREDIEAIRREQSTILKYGSTEAAAFTGEEYRQELRKGLKDFKGEVLNLPWGAGSGFSGSIPGCFFCARIGDEIFLRFIPTNAEDEITRDTLTCLQRIECARETERVLSEEMRSMVYTAWKHARKDIHDHWQYRTDPKNIEPEIRPLFRRVAEHLRKYPPEGLNQGELEAVIESVEAPWGRRYENELRTVFNEEILEKEKSTELVNKIRELGLQPFKAPEPLPPIEEDEIKLVCWLAITTK